MFITLFYVTTNTQHEFMDGLGKMSWFEPFEDYLERHYMRQNALCTVYNKNKSPFQTKDVCKVINCDC